MRFKMKQLLTVFLGLTSIIACTPEFQQGATADGLLGLAGSADSVAIFSTTLHPILVANCGACHGISQSPKFAVSDPLQSHSALINFGLVDLSNAAASRLVTKIQGGHNSFPLSLATQIQTAIEDWSNQLQSLGGGKLPAPLPLEAKFSSISQRILEPKCVSCHGPTRAASGKRLDSYSATLGTVHAGVPTDSSLYTECKSGQMPEGAPHLSAEELDVIYQWILTGAPNN